MAWDLIPWGRQSGRAAQGPLASLRWDMDRVFEEFLKDWGVAPINGGGNGETLAPRVNLSESPKELCVEAVLPGIDPKNVEVSLQKNVLTLKGEHREEKSEKGKDFHRKEFSYGSFCRALPLPVEVDPEKVDAKFKDGVLTVTLTKSSEVQRNTRKIAVKTA